MTGKGLKSIWILLIPLVLLIAAACGGDSVSEAPATSVPSQATTATAASSAQAATRAAESPEATATVPAEKLNVVTTSNIVADWVREIGGDRVDVFPLLPPNADPHTYQPGAQDITRIADADLVLSIGLSLEGGWLEDLIENAARDQDAIVALGTSVDPIDFMEIFDEHGEEEAEEVVGRLIVGYGQSGELSVIDLAHGEVEQSAFDLGGPAGRIYATRSGRFAIATSSDANNAYVLDGGIYLEGHGGHFDQVEGPMELLDIDLSGDRPVHLYAGEEWSTIFYDGSGEIILLNEHELEEEGSDYSPPSINVGPHHGAAVPLEDDVFAVTIQHPEYDADPINNAFPIGAEVMNIAGDVLHHDEGCDRLTGSAGNGHMAAFGCVGGALVVEAHDGEYEGMFISPPAGEPEDFRLTSMWGYPGFDHFFAQGSEVGMYVIDPEERAMEQLIPYTEDLSPISAAISHDGEALLVAMSDGELRMYDAHDLDLLASVRDFLTPQAERAFRAAPQSATAPGAVFITDVAGRVLQLDDHDLEIVDQWDIPVSASRIAFVGLLGDAGETEEHGHDEEEDDGHGHGKLDPHFWFDPLRVKQAVNSIAAQLSTADPAGQTFFRNNAAAYNRELDELDSWISEQVSALPEGRRVLVTSHDSFQYFAQRYGFEVAGAIFPVTTDAEPTAQDLAMLIETIEHEGVPAVFTERSHSERLAQRVAEETGTELISGLYTGSLGDDRSEAATYLDLMRHNTATIVEALR